MGRTKGHSQSRLRVFLKSRGFSYGLSEPGRVISMDLNVKSISSLYWLRTAEKSRISPRKIEK